MSIDRLVDDPDAIAALSVTVAEQTGTPAEHVEKDFWVTEVLRGVVAKAADLGVEVVFKGGTSLSKAFSLIERFSEDVDVLVVLSPQDSTGARDRTLKGLVAGAADSTTLEPIAVPEATSKGAKRGARFHYRPDATTGTGGLSAGVFRRFGSAGGVGGWGEGPRCAAQGPTESVIPTPTEFWSPCGDRPYAHVRPHRGSTRDQRPWGR